MQTIFLGKITQNAKSLFLHYVSLAGISLDEANKVEVVGHYKPAKRNFGGVTLPERYVDSVFLFNFNDDVDDLQDIELQKKYAGKEYERLYSTIADIEKDITIIEVLVIVKQQPKASDMKKKLLEKDKEVEELLKRIAELEKIKKDL